MPLPTWREEGTCPGVSTSFVSQSPAPGLRSWLWLGSELDPVLGRVWTDHSPPWEKLDETAGAGFSLSRWLSRVQASLPRQLACQAPALHCREAASCDQAP